MYVEKNFKLKGIIRFTWVHIVWMTAWVSLVTILYEMEWVRVSIPWLPLSVIGTAVAFYVGFKNNQAYSRLWEARKIWGAIVNSSRAWGSTIKAFVDGHFSQLSISQEEVHGIHQTLIYRHIAWLYSLRSQLLIPTSWEHISSRNAHMRRYTEARAKRFGLGLFGDDPTVEHLQKYLPESEYERLINYKNTATQIIDQQAQHLKELHHQGLIDDFRHMELQKILYDFYVHQGKCERIKKFPLPRQYGSASFIFVGIFIFLLPFGMVSEFQKLGAGGAWLAIPFSVLVGWVYLFMELVGDYSENPFEGLGNDIPMLALSRTIEIDLLEMLGETELPEGIKAKRGVLM
ncbi:MAG: bestrophin family ion channel [Bacteroidota bacterium]